MPDITMCKGDNCAIKQYCYRFKATPSEFNQSYFKPPIINGKCDYFWQDAPETTPQQLADMFSAKLIDNTKQ